MKLSVIISEYRRRYNLSQREFARRCDLSNSYISFLEKEYNPKTGKPITPTIEQYKKIANGMNLTVHKLFESLDDDSPVDISSVLSDRPCPDSESLLNTDEKRLIVAYRGADERAKEDALNTLLSHQVEKDTLSKVE